MPGFRDLTSERLLQFLSTHKDSLIRDVFVQFDLPKIYPLWDALNDNAARVNHRLDHILLVARSICAQHDFATFLFLFRRMPHEAALEVLQHIKKAPDISLDEIVPVYSESLLFGTNCILKFSRPSGAVARYIDLHRLVPSDAEIGDACRLAPFVRLHKSPVADPRD
jgi:hypothetical protein